MSAKPPEYKTAIHEAGHTALAIVRGHEIGSVTIEPGPGYLGIVDWTRYRAGQADDLIRGRLSGYVAERLATRWQGGSLRCAGDDLVDASAAIATEIRTWEGIGVAMCPWETVRRHIHDTESWLCSSWGAVLAVADALIVRRTLTGDDVAAIVAGAPELTLEPRPGNWLYLTLTLVLEVERVMKATP